MTFEEYIANISVMKPAHINQKNSNQVQKLESLLLSPDYVLEEKIDGCHYVCYGDRFASTEYVEKTANYPHLSTFFKRLNFPNLILDGEIFYPGRTSQYCTHVTGASSDVATSFQQSNGFIHYILWDILRTPKGTWLIDLPLYKRRKILEEFYNTCVVGTPMEAYIHLTPFILDNKKSIYEQWLSEGKEGGVLKNLTGTYILGKKPMWNWMKLKQQDTTDLFIMGYDAPKVKYTGNNFVDHAYWKDINGVATPVTKLYYYNWIGSLILGAFCDGQVKEICSCSSGLSESLRAQISENQSSFLNKVVKITFMEKTDAGNPRHPRFQSFHESKRPQDCIWGD